MSKNKDNLLTCFKNVVFAGVATFVAYVAVSMFMAAIMEHNSFSERSLAAYLFMGIVYPVVLYSLHMRNHIYTYADHRDRFDMKAELWAYIRAEGKYFLLIYGLCAIGSEIDMLIPRETVGRPVMAVCGFVLNMIWGDIPIPVLRYVLAFLYSFGVICVMAIMRSRKIYKEEK